MDNLVKGGNIATVGTEDMEIRGNRILSTKAGAPGLYVRIANGTVIESNDVTVADGAPGIQVSNNGSNYSNDAILRFNKVRHFGTGYSQAYGFKMPGVHGRLEAISNTVVGFKYGFEFFGGDFALAQDNFIDVEVNGFKFRSQGAMGNITIRGNRGTSLGNLYEVYGPILGELLDCGNSATGSRYLVASSPNPCDPTVEARLQILEAQ